MKKFNAKGVIHYGHAPDKAFKELAETWAAVMYDKVKDLTAADLRVIREDLNEHIDILADKVHVA